MILGEYPPERPHWLNKPLSIPTLGGRVDIAAAQYSELVVAPMITENNNDAIVIGLGWTIALAATGMRMASNGRVFVSAAAAQICVEQMYSQVNDWSMFFDPDIPARIHSVFNDAIDESEASGGIIPLYRVGVA